MIVVTAFRPFPAESLEHQRLGAFDWIEALRCLRASVTRSCRCETFALTDVDTELGVPSLAFQTTHRRLMLWILDVSLRFLESDRFTEDAAFISPDMLVFRDLRPYFTADLGILMRPGPKYRARPLLNSAQWWRHAAKDRLVAFYRAALERADGLPEDIKRWGADTVPLVDLLAPVECVGRCARAGLTVEFVNAEAAVHEITQTEMARLDTHQRMPWPMTSIVDFKYLRKRYLRAYFNATIGSAVAA